MLLSGCLVGLSRIQQDYLGQRSWGHQVISHAMHRLHPRIGPTAQQDLSQVAANQQNQQIHPQQILPLFPTNELSEPAH